MPRSAICRALGVLAVALLFAACSSSNNNAGKGSNAGGAATKAAAGGSPVAGGNTAPGGSGKTIIIARQTDLSTLDPENSFCDTCQIYLSAVYQTLVTLKPGSLTDAVGEIARSWDISPDLTTFTFHLDPAAKFANGDPLTSADVKFSLQRLKNLKAGPAFFMDGVKTIDGVDPQTVKFTLEGPDSAFLMKLMAPYSVIVDAKVVQANGGTDAEGADKNDKAKDYLDAHSAGSGPYVLQSWTRNTEVRLTANPNYWGPPPNPQAQTVVIKDVKDAATQRQLLERGDIDVAMNITHDVATQMQKDKDVSVQFVRSYDFLYLEANEKADPRLTKEVRQAIAAAIDYPGLIQATVGGHGIQPSTTIPQGFLGTDLVPPVKTDKAAAKSLLAKGGQPNGFSIKLAYPNQVLYGVDMNVLAQKVAADLATIGITATLSPLEIGPWGGDYSGGSLPLTLAYWAPDYPDSSEYVSWFGLVGTPGTPSEWLGNVVNDQIVALNKQAAAAADNTQRAQIYKQVIQQMQDASYDIPLVQPDLVLANRSNIQNNVYSPCCNLLLGQLVKQ